MDKYGHDDKNPLIGKRVEVSKRTGVEYEPWYTGIVQSVRFGDMHAASVVISSEELGLTIALVGLTEDTPSDVRIRVIEGESKSLEHNLPKLPKGWAWSEDTVFGERAYALPDDPDGPGPVPDEVTRLVGDVAKGVHEVSDAVKSTPEFPELPDGWTWSKFTFGGKYAFARGPYYNTCYCYPGEKVKKNGTVPDEVIRLVREIAKGIPVEPNEPDETEDDEEQGMREEPEEIEEGAEDTRELPELPKCWRWIDNTEFGKQAYAYMQGPTGKIDGLCHTFHNERGCIEIGAVPTEVSSIVMIVANSVRDDSDESGDGEKSTDNAKPNPLPELPDGWNWSPLTVPGVRAKVMGTDHLHQRYMRDADGDQWFAGGGIPDDVMRTADDVAADKKAEKTPGLPELPGKWRWSSNTVPGEYAYARNLSDDGHCEAHRTKYPHYLEAGPVPPAIAALVSKVANGENCEPSEKSEENEAEDGLPKLPEGWRWASPVFGEHATARGPEGRRVYSAKWGCTERTSHKDYPEITRLVEDVANGVPNGSQTPLPVLPRGWRWSLSTRHGAYAEVKGPNDEMHLRRAGGETEYVGAIPMTVVGIVKDVSGYSPALSTSESAPPSPKS